MDVASLAVRVETAIREALANLGSATIAISGGPILAAVLGALAAAELPWDRIRFAIADELQAPPTDPRTRYRQAYDALFSKVGFRAGKVLRFWSEGEPVQSVAGWYGTMLEMVLELPAGALPQFDLVLFELSDDGSVGSFAPGSPALGHGSGVAVPVDFRGDVRYTITGDVVRHARRVFILASRDAATSSVVDSLRPRDGELIVAELDETPREVPASHQRNGA